MKCKVTDDVPKLIRKEFTKIILRNRGKSTIEMKTLFGNYLKQLGSNYLLGNGKLLAAIEQAAKLSGDLMTKKEFFNLEEIKLIIYDTKNRSIEELAGLSETKSNELDNPEQVLDRKLSDKDFARKAYGNATDLKERVIKVGGINLVNALVIDRKNGFRVYNDADRNRNIRNYQQELLNSVIQHLHEYFNQTGRYPKAFKQIYDNHTMYDPVTGAYTGIVEKVYSYAEQSIGSKTIGNTDTLRQMASSRDSYYKNKFKAYNDWVILTHFDSFILSKYGKSIIIKNFGDGRFSGEDKYFFSEKSAYNVTSWRNEEDHDIKGTTNSIIVELIETTQKYDYGSVDNTIEGNTLTFAQYTNVISKLKDSVWESGDLEYSKLREYDEHLKLEGKPGLLDQLSESSRLAFLRAGSLKSLINLVRFDAQVNTQAIFEILSNAGIKNLIDKQANNPLKNLTKDEWDVIWSLHKGVFEVNGEHSVNGLDSEMYSYITQNVDSIFPNRFLQYYYDQDGILQVRNMRDGQDSRLKREIEQTIVTINAKMKIPDYKTVMDKYEITPIKDASGEFSGIIIKNGVKGQTIRVLKNGNVKGVLNKDIIPFAAEVLGLPEIDDSLYTILQGEYRNSSSMYQGLLNFAGRTLMLQYISNVNLKNAKTKSEIVEGLEQLFGVDWNNYVRINTDLKEINLVHKNDIPAIEYIARANAIKKGVYSSTQVKSGAGTTQSGSTFSRLLGSMQSQWVLQNRNKNSATKDSLLIRNSEIIKGVYTAKEVLHLSGTKDHTEFNTNEFANATIVHDFIGGLIPRNSRNYILGNGIIGIIPSVNSDKGTIGRIAVDTNAEVSFNHNGQFITKVIRDLSRDELISFINFELGDIYAQSYRNIQNDWNTLYKYLASKYESFSDLAKANTDYLLDFRAFKQAFANAEIPFETEYEFIRRNVIEYNHTHPFEKISLIDLVHYQNIKGSIHHNQTLIGYLKRFNPNMEELAGIDLSNYADSEQFWKVKELQVLKSLLDANFKLDTTLEQPEMEYLRNNLLKGKGWIDDSTQEMILGKLNGIAIRNIQDLETAFNELVGDVDFKSNYQNIGKLFTDFGLNFELNPILSQYNMLDYLFSQEFMISTVGSCMAHPAKGDFTAKEGTNILEPMLEMEAARYQAQHKRNVSYTASMQAFQLNTLKGIPSKYNIAIIDDIKDKQFNISGDEAVIKPYDGATYVNPFVVYLENYSLGGARAGITKKQFVHYYDERTGTGGIIKTAGFGLTNQMILNSKMIQGMMQSMTDREWRTEGGSIPDVDINHTFNGEKINFSNMYYRDGDKFYRIVDIVKQGKNQYRIIKQQVSIVGEDVGGPIVDQELTTIDTNYKLWKALGGMHSMEMHNGRLVSSENSIKKTVEVINGVGEVRPNAISKKTQLDVYQPLKHSDIHYMPTIGAVKQGAANINGANTYEMFKALADGKQATDKNGMPISTDLGTMVINMYQAGIQLDKEHHADQAELSLMTLVINACSHRGYSADQAMLLYHSLSTLTKNGIKDILEPLTDFLQENEVSVNYSALKENFITSVMNVVVGQLAHQHDDGNLISKIADDLMLRLRDGQVLTYADIEGRIPVDNPLIYNKFMSTIAVFLTDSGIKMKIPGILSILCPSYDQIKLYGNKKLEELEQDPRGFEVAIQELQDAAPYVFDGLNLNRTNLRIGRRYMLSYADGRSEVRYIQTPLQRSKLLSEIKTTAFTSVQEWVKDGRDLAAFDLHFNGIGDSTRYSLWDLDSVNIAAELKTIKPNSNEDIYKFLLKHSDFILKHISEEEQASFLRKVTSVKLAKFLSKLEKSYATVEFFDNIIANDLAALSKNGSEYIDTHTVYIDGNEVMVDLNSVETFPYEIVMSKTFMTEFGLDKFTSLQEILNDPEYFTNKILNNYRTQVSSNTYDIELKRINSNNIYLKSNSSNLSENGFTKVLTEYHTERSKVIMRDAYGEDMFEVASANDEVWQDQFGNTVIVTNNFNFYLLNFSYHLVKMSSTLTEDLFLAALNDLKTINNRLARRAYNWLTNGGSRDIEQAYLNNAKLFTGNFDLADLDMFEEIGAELYAAFAESLNVIASRTPSQSMQSFMPMKIVAYENQDVNYAYVSTAQIWLQGSDFDIDAVSLATYRISNGGRLELWSPFAQVNYDINGKPSYKDALNLPFPTGRKSKAIDLNSLSEDELKLVIDDAKQFWEELMPYVQNLFVITDLSIDGLRKIKASINTNNYGNLANFFKLINEYKSVFYIPNKEIADIYGEDLQRMILITRELYNIAQEHNTYLDKLNQTKLEHIANNYSQKQMLDIISDPMNLPHALSSVDDVVKPFKERGDQSEEGLAVKFRTPGNFMNKAESIVENQVGREAIGICATGLKTFFGLTAYYNSVINTSKDPKKLNRLILGRTGITIGEKTYYTLANVRPKLQVLRELEEILNSDHPELYYDLLEKKKNIIGNDAALQLSALLSLATDNAKELLLSKLNAGTATIGMYIYGITIGMDFNSIANILMSDVGKTITNIMRGNVFNQDYGFSSLNSVFNYLELGPNLNIFNELKFDENNKPIKSVTDVFVLLWTSNNNKFFKKYNKGKLSIKNLIGCLAWTQDPEFTINDKIDAVFKFKNVSDPTWDTRTKARYNQMIDAIVDYIKKVDVIANNEALYEDLKTLAEGAQEARLLGQLFSLNQGLPTKPLEIINKVNNILSLVQQRLLAIQDQKKRNFVVSAFKTGNIRSYKELQNFLYNEIQHIPNLAETKIENKEELEDTIYAGARFENAVFDLTKFCFDEEYREKIIDMYDEYKHTYNILDSISTVPHFFDYLRTLAVMHESAKASSARYSITVEYGKNYIEEMDIMSQDEKEYAYKGISDYIADVSRRMWMLSNDIKVPITKSVVVNGNIYPLAKNQIVPITLGTLDGDASFKLWFELVVIPDLSKRFRKNEFILNLKLQINTKNLTKNATINYTLGGINMMPRKGDDSAKAILLNMKMSFNNLSGVLYEGIPLLDLFYFYGLIAFQGKPGENSLMSIFDEYHTEGIIKDFHNFEANFSKTFTADEDMISSRNMALFPFTLSVKNPYNSLTKYIYVRNSESMDNELNIKGPSYLPGSKNGYTIVTGSSNLQIRSLYPVTQNTIIGDDNYIEGSDGLVYKINLKDSYISNKNGIIEFTKDLKESLKYLIENSEEGSKDEILKNFVEEIVNCT